MAKPTYSSGDVTMVVKVRRRITLNASVEDAHAFLAELRVHGSAAIYDVTDEEDLQVVKYEKVELCSADPEEGE